MQFQEKKNSWEKLEKLKDRLITFIFNLGLIDTKLYSRIHYRTLISPEHRRSKNYPHFHLFIKKRTQIIILEGNIACAKSTQGTILKNYIEHTVEFLDEQVEEWEPLLNKFYRSQKEYRFALQLMEAQKKYPNYIIMARSHVSGQIFWELQKPELIEHPGSFIKGTHDPEEFQEHLKKYKKYEKQSGKYYEETKILEQAWYKEFKYKPQVIYLKPELSRIFENKDTVTIFNKVACGNCLFLANIPS